MKRCRDRYHGVPMIVAFVLAGLLAGCRSPVGHPGAVSGAVFQYATLQSLIEGVYDGDLTLAELRKHGDFGIGTFNALDGEMILVDGRFYQVPADGGVREPPLSWKTPFACVIFFEGTEAWDLPEGLTYATFQQWLDARLESVNYPVAIRIQGRFESVHARSVPAQRQPYPRLPDVTGRQPEFHFGPIDGQMVGFRLPPYVAGINMAGYHLHFLTVARDGGGHLLDFVTAPGAVVTIDRRSRIVLELPVGAAFRDVDLEGDRSADVHAVERAKSE